MAVKNTSYTLADILGEPITEQEALALIKQATDSDTFRSFNIIGSLPPEAAAVSHGKKWTFHHL